MSRSGQLFLNHVQVESSLTLICIFLTSISVCLFVCLSVLTQYWGHDLVSKPLGNVKAKLGSQASNKNNMFRATCFSFTAITIPPYLS